MRAINSQICEFVEYAADAMTLEITSALADRPVDTRLLSEGERQRMAQFKLAQRRYSWLVGCAALKSLLSDMDMNTDTSMLRLPNPCFSLSHSNNLALAVGCGGETKGIGIDFELQASPRPQTARLFCTEYELEQWVRAPKPTQLYLLRKLWCIKEAAFKANPKNHATYVFDYEVEDIFPNQGTFRFRNKGPSGRFVSMPLNSAQGQACIACAIYP